MRELTVKDRPAMLSLIADWEECFGDKVKLDPAQLVDWMQRYDDEVIRKGFQVTSDWYKRQTKKALASFVHFVEVFKYASSVMRNVDRTRSTAQRILGGSL